MVEICGFCKDPINEGADACRSCGAQKGPAGDAKKHKSANTLGAVFLTLGIFGGMATDGGALVLFGPLALYFYYVGYQESKKLKEIVWHR